MNTKHVYQLNKNLDLQDENFIVKKGTHFEVLEVVVSKEEKESNKLIIKFNAINGTYILNEKDFETLLSKTELQLQVTSKFKINDCVTHTTYGDGIVAKVEYDFLIKSYIYKVKFKPKDKAVVESEIEKCK